MKKTLISAMLLVGIVATAQDARGRVGINNDAPKASLHIGRHTGIPANSPQGLILPHLTTAQRNEFNLKTPAGQNDALVEGLMIYNTNKNCIDWWNGTKWSCVDGSQPDYPPIKIDIPTTVTLSSTERFIVSIYDDNYLPYTSPTGPAELTPKDSDATKEKAISILGTIDDKKGLEVDIPVKIAGGNSVKIPAFTSHPITILGHKTQDNVQRDVVLTWDEQTVSGANSTIIAKVKTLNGELKVKQLDINNGIGNDSKGIHLGSIPYPSSSTDMVGATLDLRAIAGIPDKKFWVETNGELEHQFIYLPITGPDGRIWLNNNLGADYANINKTGIFNPAQQAKSKTDHHAYGSLFEWGRDSDGHELINWTNSTSGAVIYTGLASGTPQSTFIDTNDPCPAGFHTPTQAEQTVLFNAINRTSLASNTSQTIYSSNFWNENTLRLPAGGKRSGGKTRTEYTGNYGNYWSSSEKGSLWAWDLFFNGIHSNYNSTFREDGEAVRCISDR